MGKAGLFIYNGLIVVALSSGFARRESLFRTTGIVSMKAQNFHIRLHIRNIKFYSRYIKSDT